MTKEAGKIFCPRCGNMTLEKVEVHIGGDGAELYGVKKRHVLRGTRYSLPKPKVGGWWGSGAGRVGAALLWCWHAGMLGGRCCGWQWVQSSCRDAITAVHGAGALR